MTRRLGSASSLGALLLLATSLCGPAAGEIYHWVDEHGVPHFTDRLEGIPQDHRAGVRNIEPELEAASPDHLLEDLESLASEWKLEQRGGDSGAPELPGFEGFQGQDPQEMLDQMMEGLKGPMIVGAVFAFLIALAVLCALVTPALLFACRLVRQESPGFAKGYAIVLVQVLASSLAGPGVAAVVGEPSSLGGLLGLQAISLAAALLVQAAVLRAMLCPSFWKALGLTVVMTLVILTFGLVCGLLLAVCAGGSLVVGGP